MIHGLYLSAQGANAQIVRQDVISNNLANASTTGFKRDVAELRSWDPNKLGRDNIPIQMQGGRQNSVGAITLDRTTTIHTDGSLQRTDGQLDIAIHAESPDRPSDGFLRVRGPNNQEFLTRNGRMRRDEGGFLVSDDTGYPVLDPAGNRITVPDGNIEIDRDGTLMLVTEDSSTDVAQIGLFSAPFDQMRKVGANLFEVNGQITPADNATVKQGFLEASSVEPTRELVSLIDASRTFEANVNMLRMQDESLGRLLQSFSG